MIRAVLDTNTIVCGIGWGGPPRVIRDAAIAGDFVLLMSADLLEEIRRVLTYPRLRALPPARVREVLALLPLIAQMVEPEGRISIVRQDPADNRVLECALAGEATHIVTGDDHLLALRSFRGIRVVAPATFLKIVRQWT